MEKPIQTTQWGDTLEIQKSLQLENFGLETQVIQEKMKREAVELSQFSLETTLIEKGVL